MKKKNIYPEWAEKFRTKGKTIRKVRNGYGLYELGGAGGPLAVYLIAIVASEVGKLVSKETKVDILVTPAATILVGVGLSVLCAPAIGAAASSVGNLIMWATELQPFLMGILVSVLVGIALTLPISEETCRDPFSIPIWRLLF